MSEWSMLKAFPFSFKIKYQQFSHILSTQLTGIEHFNAEFPSRCILLQYFCGHFTAVFLQLFRCSIFAATMYGTLLSLSGRGIKA